MHYNPFCKNGVETYYWGRLDLDLAAIISTLFLDLRQMPEKDASVISIFDARFSHLRAAFCNAKRFLTWESKKFYGLWQ